MPPYTLTIEMGRSSRNGFEEPSDLLVEIVGTLERYGLDCNDYQLYDFVDVEALAQLLNSASSDIEVRFTVEGIQLIATPEGVTVPVDEESYAVQR
ncbi:HalOD1 output domain-containing protein [Halopenitus persicus]|uniref:HalOD1 output domain-containing protein n=1 Tax=Halopenitus persicus TaxID=1048396 RepID=UPI001E5BFA73|nr:HalOD1 output domain-containing protein [Halopenitus persicus]